MTPRNSPTAALPARPQAVLFDMDGVLLHSGQLWHVVVNQVIAGFGGAPVTYEAFMATFGQGVAADMAQYYPGHSRPEVEAAMIRCFLTQLDAMQPMPGAADVLDALAAQGIARAVVTNTPTALATKMLAHFGLLERVQLLVGGGDAAEKPAPDLIHLALARLGLDPSQVLYVGDSWADGAATRAAGVFMLGLGTDEGDRRIARLDELLGWTAGVAPEGG